MGDANFSDAAVYFKHNGARKGAGKGFACVSLLFLQNVNSILDWVCVTNNNIVIHMLIKFEELLLYNMTAVKLGRGSM